jgi:hypothetical protein
VSETQPKLVSCAAFLPDFLDAEDLRWFPPG